MRLLTVAALYCLLPAFPQQDLLQRVEAATSAEEAQALIDSSQATTELASAFLRRADELNREGKFAPAERFFQAAKGTALRAGNQLQAAKICRALALSYRRQGRQQDAITVSQEGIRYAQAAADSQTLAELYRTVGLGLRALGDSEPAIAALVKSRDLCRTVKNTVCELGAINNIGIVQTDQGEFRAAAATLLEAQPRSMNMELESSILNNLAVVYANQGDGDTAAAYYERALQVSRKTGDKQDLAIALTNLTDYYGRGDSFDRGFAAANEAIALATEIKNPRVAGSALVNRGELNHQHGHPEAALADWQQALELFRAAGRAIEVSVTLGLIGALHAELGHDREALEFAALARTAATTAGSTEALRTALDTFGKVYRRAGRAKEAKAAYEQEIAVLEAAKAKLDPNQVASFFLAGKMNPYYGLMEIAITEGRNEAALQTLERAKARRLLDVLTNGRADIARSLSTTERQQEQKLSDVVEAKTIGTLRADSVPARQQLDAAQRELTAFRSVLRAAHPELKLRSNEAAAFSLPDAESLLPSNTALVEYALFDDRLSIFVLTRAPQLRLRVVSTPWRGTDAAREVDAFRSALAGRRLSYRVAGQALYQKLIAPIASELKGKSTIGFIPDGVLWNVPLQALPQPGGRHVLEDYAVFYAPSLTVLRESTKAKAELENKLLAFGAPELGRFAGALAPDPESGIEVQQVAGLYKGVVHTGNAATKANWRGEAPGATILHLATHGVLNTNNPLYSYLVMSDGVIEAREILDMNLRAKVVVLSACETGRGSFSPGEGLIGMSWAFLVAGSRTTVVSQWKVDSGSTRELMVRFHRALRGERADAASALQRAALQTMQLPEFRHPFYWAGFVVVGAGR